MFLNTTETLFAEIDDRIAVTEKTLADSGFNISRVIASHQKIKESDSGPFEGLGEFSLYIDDVNRKWHMASFFLPVIEETIVTEIYSFNDLFNYTQFNYDYADRANRVRTHVNTARDGGVRPRVQKSGFINKLGVAVEINRAADHRFLVYDFVRARVNHIKRFNTLNGQPEKNAGAGNFKYNRKDIQYTERVKLIKKFTDEFDMMMGKPQGIRQAD